jgi:uncharacterized repeat protein (TIGR01451 family)
MKEKAQTWHLRGALGLAVVFVAGLFVSGAFGGVSPLGSTSSGSTDTGTSASVSSSTGSTSTTSAQTGSTVPYIVTFSGGTSSSDQTSEIAAAGATDVGDIAPLSMHSIDVPADSEAAVVAALQANANVAGVERDRSRETDAVPDDPGYADQWNLPLIGWDQIYGSVNPLGSSTIAVLDTGVSGSTGDLHLGAGWSAFGTDPTQDTNGHGTAVASIAAATAGNGIGIAGVDFGNPTILPVQVLDSSGLGQDSDIIQGVVWAADHGAGVILMSFSNPGFSQALQDAVNYAWGKGAVVVAATGNDGSASPTYPAGDAGVMGVAGTDQSDQPWSGSNTGADTFIAAPATQIPADATDGSETAITGTSASAAEVAGASALLLQNDANTTNAIVDGRLARNADPVGTTDQTGNGRLDLARASADTSTDPVTPLGAPGGGPFVGPYIAAANLTLTPSSGPPGTSVTPTGNGYGNGKSATVTFNGTQVSTCITTSGNLTAGCAFTVPANGTTAPNNVCVSTPDPGGGQQCATFTVTQSSADLSITKTDGVSSVNAGGSTTYTIRVTNNGPSSVTGATLTDAAATGLSKGTIACSATPGQCTSAPSKTQLESGFALPTLANGQFYEITVQAGVTATSGSVTNTATVAAPSGTTDPTPGNNSATDTDTVNPVADLSITKTDGVTSAVPGTSTTYTITVGNAGPSPVTGASVADTFPAKIASDSWTATGAGGASGFTAGGSGNIDDSVNLPVGATVTYTVTAQIASSATGSLTNTATVTAPSGVTDPTPGNDSATDSDTLTPQADLAAVKTDDHGGNSTTSTAGSVVPGSTLTYTVTFSNSGPSDAVGASVTDSFPSDFTGATWTATQTGGASGFTAGGSGNISDTVTMPSGSTLTYTVTGTVKSSATGTLSNTATASDAGGATDPTPSNNSATDTDNLGPQADLGVTKDDGSGSVVAGTSTTYTVTLTNHGPSDAPAGQVVSDAAPAGTTISSSDSRCSISSNAATCTTNAALPAGQSTSFALTLAVDSNYVTAQGSSLTNTASITASPGLDQQTNPGNDTATDTDTVSAQADLSVTKDGPASAVAGSTYSYTLTVKNDGKSDNAGGFTVSDTLPSELGFVTSGSSASCNASGQVVTCTDPSGLTAGATESFTVVVEVDPATTAGTVIANHATVASTGTTDPNSANDQSSPDTLTTVTSDVALSLTKTFSPSTVVAGSGDHTFTLAVKNTGTFSTAHSVEVTDTVDPKLVVTDVSQDQGANGSCAPASQSIDCTFALLPAGNTATVTVTYHVAADKQSQSVDNTANAATPDNNATAADTKTLSVVSDVALSLTKSFAPDTAVTAGDGQHTFTLATTNTGTFSTAHDVHVTDSVPAGIVVDAVHDDQGDTNCTASLGQSVDCTFALLPAGQTATVTITYHVDAATQAQSIDNTANAASPDNDSQSSDAKTLTVNSDVALSLAKTFTPDTVTAGDGNHTFTLAATNDGTFSTAHSVEITDSVDSRLVVTGVGQDQGSGGSCAPASQSIDCTFALLPHGQTATVTVTYHVDPSTEAGTVTNDATATSPDNNQSAPASDTLTIKRDADLSVTKTAATDPTQPNTDETFTVTVKNLGPSANAGYTLGDVVPAGTSFVSASSGCNYDGSSTVTCTSSGLAFGATETFTITVHVAADYPHNTKLSNTASIASTATPDSVSADDSSTATVDVASIALTKIPTLDETVVPPDNRVDSGDLVNYTFQVENTGSVTLTDALVTDPLTGTHCTIASLAPAAVDNTTCSGAYTLTQADVDNGSVSNTAHVTAAATNGVNVTDDSTATTTLPAAPSVSITKTPTLHSDVAGPPNRVDAGDTISYVFSVENTGNVTLTGVTVTDPLTGTNCSVGTLAPGQTDNHCTATYTLLQSDVDLGSRSNTATATGNPPQGDPVSDDDTATVPLPAAPALQLSKTTQSAPFDHPGQELDYTYTLTNTGNVTLGGPFAIQDDRSTDAACPASPSSIAPGDSISCTGTYHVTQDDIDAGSVTNHATGTANFQNGTVTSNEDEATVQAIQTPSVSLTKTATETTYTHVGDVLHYTYKLKNTGNVTLSNPSVTDTNTDAPVTLSNGNNNGKLNVGETWTFTATHTVTQADLDNGAVTNDATGHTTFGGSPVDSAPQSVTILATQLPSLTLVKVADTATYDHVGQVINYTYTLQNSGNVTLGQSTVSDDNIDFGPDASYFSGDTNLNGKMDPGEAWVFKGQHTVNSIDIFEGSIINHATGSAPFTPYSQSQTTIYSNGATTTVSNAAADVAITKSASPDPVLVNDQLTYTLTVSNGTSTQHSADGVTVSDPVPSGTTFVSSSATNGGTCDATVTCTFASLAPGASATITIVVTPTSSGPIKNTASVLATESDPDTSNNTASVTTTANPRPTTLVYSGDTTQDFNDPFTASATLTDTTTGNPVAGKSVTLKLNNAESCSGTTTAAGVASCQITPGEAAGTYNVTANFAGDSVYAASSATPTTFTVKHEETTTTYTGPSGPIQNGTSVSLSGVLEEDGTTPISGRTLTLSLGSQSCSGTTNASGVATCSVTVNQPLGPGTAGASFAGDGYYVPSSDSKTTLIYASASGGNGAFVVGDNSATGNVYFWGSQWASLNNLSSGAAPSSFKGFAKQPGSPSCGASWSTDPGNSAPPPAGPLPSYIAVIVTSKSTKSGSQISGNIVHIVIVKVNAGYTTDPGHPGTGTVVATVC